MKKMRTDVDPECFMGTDLGSDWLFITDCRKGTYIISDLKVKDFCLYYGHLCLLYDIVPSTGIHDHYEIFDFNDLKLVTLDYYARVTPVKARIEIYDVDESRKRKYIRDEEEDDY